LTSDPNWNRNKLSASFLPACSERHEPATTFYQALLKVNAMSLPSVHDVAPSPKRAAEALSALIESKELDLSGLQRGYLRSRWLEQLLHTEREVRRAKQCYRALRVIMLVGSLLILMLVSIGSEAQPGLVRPGIAHASTIFLSLLVSASVALEFIFNFGERWHRLEHRLGRLHAEGWRFLQLSGHYRHYDNHASAFTAFVNQIEELSQREVEVYNSAVMRERRRDVITQEEARPKKLEPPPPGQEATAAATGAQPLQPTARQNPMTRAASQTRT
jgi:hypothetical protein